MTEFKKGDRVKVEIEGDVDYVSDSLVDIKVGGRIETLFKQSVTLLERPVEPLAVGSVVKSTYGGTFIVRDAHVVYLPDRGYSSLIEGPRKPEVTTHETAESLARTVRD